MNLTASALQDLVAGSHRALVEARIVPAGQTGDDPEGLAILIEGGDVAFDASANVFANASLTTDGAELWPRHSSDPLAPYGTHELFLRRGIATGPDPYWSALGYFRLDVVGQDRAARGPITLTCPDRMQAIIDARFLGPRQIKAGRVVGEVIRELVNEVLPLAEVVFADVFEFATIARTIIVEEDRYQAIRDIVRAGGQIMFWDGAGRLQIRPAPDATAAPLWELAAGENGVLIDASRTLSRQGVRNIVVARGEGADMSEPVQSIAADMSPSSPTYVHGPFGPVPRFYSSPLISTEEQAFKAAAALLGNSLGMAFDVGLTAVCNPAVRPWDCVRVTYDSGDREVHVMDTATVPLLASSPLTGTTREQTRTLIRRYS